MTDETQRDEKPGVVCRANFTNMDSDVGNGGIEQDGTRDRLFKKYRNLEKICQFFPE